MTFPLGETVIFVTQTRSSQKTFSLDPFEGSLKAGVVVGDTRLAGVQ